MSEHCCPISFKENIYWKWKTIKWHRLVAYICSVLMSTDLSSITAIWFPSKSLKRKYYSRPQAINQCNTTELENGKSPQSLAKAPSTNIHLGMALGHPIAWRPVPLSDVTFRKCTIGLVGQRLGKMIEQQMKALRLLTPCLKWYCSWRGIWDRVFWVVHNTKWCWKETTSIQLFSSSSWAVVTERHWCNNGLGYISEQQSRSIALHVKYRILTVTSTLGIFLRIHSLARFWALAHLIYICFGEEVNCNNSNGKRLYVHKWTIHTSFSSRSIWKMHPLRWLRTRTSRLTFCQLK